MNNFRLLITIALSALASQAVLADDFLNGDQIKELVTGNTVQAEHLRKGFDFAVYFDADGQTAVRKQDGEETETSYRIDGDKHCIHWKGKDRCAEIRDNGDGSYDRINANGKAVVRWSSFTAGRQL